MNNDEEDYYKILGVSKNVSEQDIKSAYKKKALKYHPDKNKNPYAEDTFKAITAAYKVLIDKEERKKYDRKRKKGRMTIDEFYQTFFTRDSNFFQQDPPIYKDLYVTLNEVNEGVIKKMQITRNVFHIIKGVEIEKKILYVQIQPGWKEGTMIKFEREGDQKPGTIPADIIFIIKDKAHPLFKRDGVNLIYSVKISQTNALSGFNKIKVPTLQEDEEVLFTLNEIITPQTRKYIKGYGLPFHKNPTKRGDIIVYFDIQV